MPPEIQVKLLHVLQNKRIYRVGSSTPIDVDVRVITATNRNLEEEVKKGRFRQDLYYRLNVIELRIPPLRERIEDLGAISKSIIEELNVQMGLSVTGIDEEAMEVLRHRQWRGNVRELRNHIERAMNFAKDSVLHIDDFSFEDEIYGVNLSDLDNIEGRKLIDQVRNDAERKVIIKVLEHFGNNKSKAAEYLDIARPLLYQKMKRLGIK